MFAFLSVWLFSQITLILKVFLILKILGATKLPLMPEAVYKHVRQTLLCISLIIISFDKINDAHHFSTMKLTSFFLSLCRGLL